MVRKDFTGNLIRVKILREEVEYYKTLLQEHDTGHIHTTISFLESRIAQLEGKEIDDPFLELV